MQCTKQFTILNSIYFLFFLHFVFQPHSYVMIDDDGAKHDKSNEERR